MAAVSGMCFHLLKPVHPKWGGQSIKYTEEGKGHGSAEY